MSIVKLNQTTLQSLSELKEKISNLEKLGSNIDVAWAIEAIHNNNTLLSLAEKIKQRIRFDNPAIFLTKDQIRVTIDSVEKQRRAIQILDRYCEPIYQDELSMHFTEKKKHLRLGMALKEWLVTDSENHTEITLDELEEVLKNS